MFTKNLKNKLTKITTAILLVMLCTLQFAGLPTVYAADPVNECTKAGWTPDPKVPTKCTKDAKLDNCGELPKDFKRISKDGAAKTICERSKDDPGPSPDVAIGMANNLQLLSSVQTFLNTLIWPVLVLIGGLMENDLLFGGGMEERLRDIWVPIRNLVNILFIIVLVGLALYNVLGLGEESSEYSIKSALPKIIIGIIAINFSFLGIKVVLDAVTQVTSYIFALPGNVSVGLDQVVDEKDTDLIKSLCTALQGNADIKGNNAGQYGEMSSAELKQQTELKMAQTAATVLKIPFESTDNTAAIEAKAVAEGGTKKADYDKKITNLKSGQMCTDDKTKLTPQGKQFLKRYNSRNAAFALALNMGKIVFYRNINWDVKNIEKLAVNTIFSLLLYLVYVASFLALFVVLLARLVVMWLCIAISPLLLLIIAAPSLKDKFGELGKIGETFTKNAMAPILIALPMSIGWIMLKAVQSLTDSGSFTTGNSITFDPTGGVPVVGLNTLQDFMVALGTIAVVWIGVFSAAEGTIAKGATDWLKGALTKAGTFIGTLPLKHMPFIPISLPGHEHAGHYTASQVGRALENMLTPDDNKLADMLRGGKSSTKDEIPKIKSKGEMVSFLQNANEGDLKNKDWVKDLHKQIGKIGGKTQLLSGTTGDERKGLEALVTLVKPGNENNIDANAKEVKRFFRKADSAAPPGGTSTSKANQADKTGKIDGNPAVTQKPGETTIDFEKRITEINKTAINLATNIEAKDNAKITKDIKSIKTKGIATSEDLKKWIPEQYDALVTALGGGAKGEGEVKKLLGEPAAPTAGTPTPGGGTSGGTSPAPASPAH